MPLAKQFSLFGYLLDKYSVLMPKIVLTLLFLPFFNPTLHAQLNFEQIGHLPYPSIALAGCKGFVDSTGREWALVGTSIGLSLVDLENPTQPVERFAVPGLQNGWREMALWQGFAYVGSEAQGSGITIVDLRSLPDTVTWKTWFGDGAYDSLVQRSHTLQAYEGRLYIFGGGNVTNGATIADLSDPWNPHIVGKYTLNNVHDGYIRGDTLWTSEIFEGQFAVVDISDVTDPQLILTHPTPGNFNHNTELSGDSKILFTTDEKSGAPLAAFDVSDLDNITLLDKYFPSQVPQGMVHNVRVFGDFLVNPSYGGQLTIVDASRPDNLIETAWVTQGNALIWDAWPYLPSGIVFSTARNAGLFIYQPTYQHAAWLEGTVTDSLTGQPLGNARVFVLNTPNADTTKTNGLYKTGAAMPGSYILEVLRSGYHSKTISNVALESGVVTALDIALVPEVVATGQPDPSFGITVYPTLFDDQLTVEIPAGSAGVLQKSTLRLLDFSGKTVLETHLNGPRTVLNGLHRLPAGIYVVDVADRYRCKLVKQ